MVCCWQAQCQLAICTCCLLCTPAVAMHSGSGHARCAQQRHHFGWPRRATLGASVKVRFGLAYLPVALQAAAADAHAGGLAFACLSVILPPVAVAAAAVEAHAAGTAQSVLSARHVCLLSGGCVGGAPRRGRAAAPPPPPLRHACQPGLYFG